MPAHDKLTVLAVSLPLVIFAVMADTQRAAADTDVEYVAKAMTAAPREIAAHATIMRITHGSMQTLKAGTNEITCMIMAGGPMCASPIGMDWVYAWQTHGPPPDGLGLIYRLSGGTGMSNTDPWATNPTPGNHWVKTGAHIMMVGLPVKKMLGFPRTLDPDSTKPFVMWSGTPYEYVIIPLAGNPP